MAETSHWDLLEVVPDAVVLVRRDGRIVYANAQAERLFGFAPGQLIDCTVEDLLPETSHASHREHREDFFRNPKVRAMGTGLELLARRQDGSQVPVDINLSPTKTAEGWLVGASIRDISERKRSQQLMESREATFAMFFENAPVPILLLDGQGKVCEKNRAAQEALAGLPGGIGDLRFGSAIRCVHSTEVPGGCGHSPACPQCPVRELVNRTLREGITHRQVEARLMVQNGQAEEDRYLLVSTAVSTLPEGRRVLVSLEDITLRKRAELGLQNALSEIQRLKDRLQQENVYLREEIKSSHDFEEIVGNSGPLQLALQKIDHVAKTDATVLILGETGTGKELIARAIHNRSRRKDRPLVKVNCAALPNSLIESELFGHVKGAFTGAVADKIGRFELADGGTIFLDEIGELQLDLQAKLLRVLQESQFERIGTPITKIVDVRVIAATNRDLHRAVAEGTFRSDLYYRLAVFPVELPPLRLRREDIPLLIWHFITKKQAALGKRIESVSKPSLDALIEYDWPGNVRELENVIERAVILSPNQTLVLDEVFATLPTKRPAEVEQPDHSRGRLEQVERAHILEVLESCRWKIKGPGNAAERLGLKPSTLRYRMNKLGIQRPG